MSRGKLIALAICGVLGGAVAWYVGMDPWHATGVAAVIAAIGFVWMAVPERLPIVWPLERQAADDGNRNDVNRLSWSLRTRRARVRPDAVRRVRQLAMGRLASRGIDVDHPLDIDDPTDRQAIERLIGTRAYRTLRRNPVRLPTFHDIEQCLDALSRLIESSDAVADPPARTHHAIGRKSRQ